MGVRFHRSVRITKGVRLNISKKGLGVSIGPRGAKISFGPSGVYSNVGIPGTGIYSRTKLNGRSNNKTSNNKTSNTSKKVTLNLDITITIDDETGDESITIFEGNREIKDASILRKVKSNPNFKEKLANARETTVERIMEKTNILLDIHKHSEEIPNWEEVLDASKTKKPEFYVKKEFPINKPQIDEIKKKLEDEAFKNVHPIFNRAKKRKEYIDIRLDEYLEKAISKWQIEKTKFEEKERAKEVKLNEKYKTEFDNWMNTFNQTYYPTEEYITKTINDNLSEIRIPVDFSVDFDVLKNCKQVYLDIDLPEIEDYPQKKARILSTGKISVKDKSKKEKHFDYLRSTSSMSIYFASMVFSISPVIEEVIISGYTQRLNKATGNIEDEYVYSVKYDSNNFRKLNIEKIDPELTIKSFESRIKTTAQYEMKAIKPFEI
jgi:hypothetical protein